MKNNKLYHGTNENHEFWENENYVILRVHKEKEWSLHKKDHNYAFFSFHSSASDAASSVNCELDSEKQWVKTDKGFVLK